MPDYAEYKLPDDVIIGGANATEIVEAMAKKKFTEPRSRASYRRASARRAKQLYSVDLDPTTDESYVASMINFKLLVPLQ